MTGSSAWQRPQSPAPGRYPQGYGQAYPPTAPPVAYGGGGYFPPGTPPDIVSCFQRVDRDFSGFIDERELQAALCSGYHPFSMRTVRLLMFLFNSTGDSSKIGPNEFVALWTCLGQWRAIFERFDRDRSGKIDAGEFRDALLSLGYAVPPTVLQVLLSKYQNNDQYGVQGVLNFDSFVECGLIIKVRNSNHLHCGFQNIGPSLIIEGSPLKFTVIVIPVYLSYSNYLFRTVFILLLGSCSLNIMTVLVLTKV
ncbi:calcium-binding protein CBP isoform X2 [Nymphaea colorata]|nr:calcium-binding protein CBP isoform X2 [Nymphaea colorata]